MHANTNNRIPKVIQRNTEKGYENSERRRTCFHAEPSNCTQSSLEETPLSLPALGSIPAGWGAKQRLTTNSKASRWFCQLSSGSLPISYSPHPGAFSRVLVYAVTSIRLAIFSAKPAFPRFLLVQAPRLFLSSVFIALL